MPVLAIGGEHSLGKYVEMLMQDFTSNLRGSVIKDYDPSHTMKL
jgi:hypothetical protein